MRVRRPWPLSRGSTARREKRRPGTPLPAWKGSLAARTVAPVLLAPGYSENAGLRPVIPLRLWVGV